MTVPISLADSRLSLEEDDCWRLGKTKAWPELLQLAVGGALVVVVVHVLLARELELGDDRVATRARVFVGHAGAQVKNVGLAVLRVPSARCPRL